MCDEQETWRDVVGFEGHYKVSDKGRVFNVRTGRMLEGTASDERYRQVRLTPDNGRVITVRIHRLVCTAFHGPPPEGYVVNHKNGRKADNAKDNLEWCTRAENCRHAAKMGLLNPPRGERNCKAKLTESDVRAMRRMSSEGWSPTQIARRFGVSAPTAYRAITRQSWKHIPDDDSTAPSCSLLIQAGDAQKAF